jgi:hypothetical protein
LDEMQKGGRKVSRGCEEREKCGAGKRGGGRWRPVCFKGVTAAGSMERNGGGSDPVATCRTEEWGVWCCIERRDGHAVGGGRSPGTVAVGCTAWAPRIGDRTGGVWLVAV